MFFFPDTCRIHSTIPLNIPKASNVTWFSRNTKSAWFTECKLVSTGVVCVSRTPVCYISITATGSVNGPQRRGRIKSSDGHIQSDHYDISDFYKSFFVRFPLHRCNHTIHTVVVTIEFARSCFSLRYRMLVSNICGFLSVQNGRSGSKVTKFVYVI